MKEKILVVDDDPDVMLFNRTVVEEEGYLPLTASNGEEGLALLKNESPDMVILDVLMPKQSGIKMYRAVKTRESWKHIPIIILSGISKRSFLKSQEVLTEFGEQPVPEPELYLEKPVEAEELAAAIREVLEKSRAT
ncbi:MAG: response regulator [Desulfohalobiaceae bacterium]|nr:response regulator [Desulfohalobiaceae bacterium]MCF8106641.1 response regulator [Desulfohalobiaceae bacterium]